MKTSEAKEVVSTYINCHYLKPVILEARNAGASLRHVVRMKTTAVTPFDGGNHAVRRSRIVGISTSHPVFECAQVQLESNSDWASTYRTLYRDEFRNKGLTGERCWQRCSVQAPSAMIGPSPSRLLTIQLSEACDTAA